MPKKKTKTKKIQKGKTVRKSKAVVRSSAKDIKKAKKTVRIKKPAKAVKIKRALSKITPVGGLSFSHGIMMRTHDGMAVVMQEDKGDMEIVPVKLKGIRKKYSFLFWPFIRGIFYLIETIYFSLGILWHKSYFVKRKLRERTVGQRFIINAERALRYFVYILLTIGLFDFIGNRISLYPATEACGISFLYAFLINLAYILLFVILFILVSFSKRIGAQALYYHSAEHQILNAYERYGYRDDLLEKAEKASKIHPRCGITVFFWSIVLLSLALNVFKVIDSTGAIVFAVSLGLVLLSFAVSYEIVRLSSSSKNNILSYIFIKPLYLIQYLAFRRPAKRHLVAGLCALTEAIRAGK